MRKRPDLVDVFEVDKPDYEKMTRMFEKLATAEYNRIEEILGEETALDVINESYNYCVAGDYGKVSLN